MNCYNKYELLAKGIIDQLVWDYFTYKFGKINNNDRKYNDYIIAKKLIESNKECKNYHKKFETLCLLAELNPIYLKDNIKKISKYIEENSINLNELKRIMKSGRRLKQHSVKKVPVAQLDRATAF